VRFSYLLRECHSVRRYGSCLHHPPLPLPLYGIFLCVFSLFLSFSLVLFFFLLLSLYHLQLGNQIYGFSCPCFAHLPSLHRHQPPLFQPTSSTTSLLVSFWSTRQISDFPTSTQQISSFGIWRFSNLFVASILVSKHPLPCSFFIRR
jgi:hypothetical protein